MVGVVTGTTIMPLYVCAVGLGVATDIGRVCVRSIGGSAVCAAVVVLSVCGEECCCNCNEECH